jgi:hypothetical protein
MDIALGHAARRVTEQAGDCKLGKPKVLQNRPGRCASPRSVSL